MTDRCPAKLPSRQFKEGTTSKPGGRDGAAIIGKEPTANQSDGLAKED